MHLESSSTSSPLNLRESVVKAEAAPAVVAPIKSGKRVHSAAHGIISISTSPSIGKMLKIAAFSYNFERLFVAVEVCLKGRSNGFMQGSLNEHKRKMVDREEENPKLLSWVNQFGSVLSAFGLFRQHKMSTIHSFDEDAQQAIYEPLDHIDLKNASGQGSLWWQWMENMYVIEQFSKFPPTPELRRIPHMETRSWINKLISK
ncbi:hypothetical protein Tco_0657755 [Tanacetum coccineum]